MPRPVDTLPDAREWRTGDACRIPDGDGTAKAIVVAASPCGRYVTARPSGLTKSRAAHRTVTLPVSDVSAP